MTWRGVRPLLPGVANRLAGPAAATAAATTTASTTTTIRTRTWARPLLTQTPCVLCRPRRTLAFHYSTTTASDENNNKTNASNSHAGTDDSLSPSVISWQAIAKEGEDRRRRDIEDQLRQQLRQSAAAAASSSASPGTVLMDSLARDEMASSSQAEQDHVPSPPASALTKPLIVHVHDGAPGENERSRRQHVKSVVRQGRLEIMRQMQDLHMVDWRQVLRRLAISTPREESHEQVSSMAAATEAVFSERDAAVREPAMTTPTPAKIVGWRKNAVLFAFPDNSPSVAELVGGVDDSMWSIWSRTACVLRLFRWQGASSSSSPSPSGLDFTSRPWLLSLSGPNETAISHAVLDVVRFAKDAETVSLAAADLELLDNVWTRRTAAAAETQAEEEGVPASKESRESKRVPWKLESSSYFFDSKYCDDPVFQPYVTDLGAHDIPRPDVWTPDAFERYVAALVNGTPPPQLGTQIYHMAAAEATGAPRTNVASPDSRATTTTGRQQPDAPSHSHTVIGLLHRAFHDDAARASVTLSAFKMALTYMCRFGEANRPDVRALFTRVEELQIPMDTATFNILLASHVKLQDVRNYGSTLRLMRSRRHGYTPDLTTWLLFLRLFGSEDVKRHILHTMFARGLLNTSRAVRLVALEMAEHDAQQAVRQATSLSEFMARQAQRYGPRWLSRAAANRILDVFASHGRFAECDALLAALQEQQDAETYRPRRPKSKLAQARARARQQQQQQQAAGGSGGATSSTTTNPLKPPPGFVSRLSLDTFTYNIVLMHCKTQTNLDAALLVLRRMEVAGAPKVPDGLTSHVVGRPWLPPIPPDSATYHLLFSLAWARRLPHAMAVVWHYACLSLQARHWLLLRASREHVELADGRHVPLAYYLTGVDVDTNTNADANLNPQKLPPRSISGHRPVHQAGLEMSTRIAARYRGWEPAEPLSKVLQDAIDRDAAMQDASAPPPPPMRILLRKRGIQAEDEVLTGRKSSAYLEIPVRWGPFKAIEYSR